MEPGCNHRVAKLNHKQLVHIITIYQDRKVAGLGFEFWSEACGPQAT